MALLRSEWPGNVIDKMSGELIETVIALRAFSGVPLIPSPIEEAHVRYEDGTSRHAIGQDGTKRRSDATDLYVVNNKDAPKLWRMAQTMAEIGGIGVYFDTVFGGGKRVLFHFDTRMDRLLWLCPSRDRETEKREYIYYRDNNPGVFLDLLSAEFSRL